MLSRFLLAAPVAIVLTGLSFWSLAAHPPEPADPLTHALTEEAAGDLAAAERDLLAAAQFDHLYEPRWTLAGFYFRHDRKDDFWLWTRRALEVATRDLGALFDLCWHVTDDSAVIWQRAIPERREIWNEYLAYLLAMHHDDAARETAQRLATRADRDDVPLLLGYCDLRIESRDNTAAAPVWNELCRRGLVDAAPIGPRSFLVNGSLAHKPSGRCFDWRLASAAGARVEWTPGQLHFTLTGSQAPDAELVSQPLALPAGAAYRLTWRSLAHGFAAGTGAHWEVLVDGARMKGPSLANEVESAQQMEFTIPPNAHAATLSLRCDAGRGAGTVLFRDLDIGRR